MIERLIRNGPVWPNPIDDYAMREGMAVADALSEWRCKLTDRYWLTDYCLDYTTSRHVDVFLDVCDAVRSRRRLEMSDTIPCPPPEA